VLGQKSVSVGVSVRWRTQRARRVLTFCGTMATRLGLILEVTVGRVVAVFTRVVNVDGID